MKTKSLFLAALAMISSAVAFAGKDEPRETGLAVIPVKNTEVYKVIYKGESAGKVTLNIYNASGTLLLSQKITGTDGFIVPLNFKGLATGEYTVELVDATGKKMEKISYVKKGLKNIHISRLANDASKFLVSIPNKNSEVISINIYDDKSNLLHSQSTTISGDFAQVYKLDSATSSYTFEIKDSAGNAKTIKF